MKADGMQSSYLWGYSYQYPIAGVTNASSNEIYYTGFEETTGVGIQIGTGHTGERYSTNSSISWTAPAGRSYLINYWFFQNGVWKFSGEQPYNGVSFTMQAASGYDDIRIYPSDAQMTTYTYKPLVGMTSMTDARGQTTYYEYDNFQRLKAIKDAEGNIIKQYDYHYKP